MKTIDLYWQRYKFFPYEKQFALKEIETLLRPATINDINGKVTITLDSNYDLIKKLVYFSHASIDNDIIPTQQFHFENGSGTTVTTKRQNTRYSVHGLHEYKGKFNPQVVKSLLNIYDISSNDLILDPFCGSGTTLVEAAHNNINAIGTDINPLATFIANTKVATLNIKSIELSQAQSLLLKKFEQIRNEIILDETDIRIKYLKSWFPANILLDIEALRMSASEFETPLKDIFLTFASNLLRDYSLQEPSDLRIRRRISDFPSISLKESYKNSINAFKTQFQEFQSTFGLYKSNNRAYNLDIKLLSSTSDFSSGNIFDFAVTSPPYANALPYIDTQRLSLVWLDFITPKEIRSLESELIGSREYKMKAEQKKWQKHLIENKFGLNCKVQSFCLELNSKLNSNEGFRKQAVPSLLYKYFYEMSLAFKEVHKLLKPNKYFCLIVGHNHTTIGGKRTDINTPELLSLIGNQVGFLIHEIIPLEAYHRYGLNSSNSVQSESLIVFKK